jgi:hypothetical protein
MLLGFIVSVEISFSIQITCATNRRRKYDILNFGILKGTYGIIALEQLGTNLKLQN